MRSYLNDNGYKVGTKHVRRLMRQMGLEAIYPVKSLSKPGKTVYKAPYLLRNDPVKSFNHVWSMDISYIAMKEGFMYMIGNREQARAMQACLQIAERSLYYAIIDVYSRIIVGCRLTNTLDARDIVKYIDYYNNRRHYQGIDNRIPVELCPKENPDLARVMGTCSHCRV